MGYRETYNLWLSSEAIDEATKEELRSIADDEKEIEDRFYQTLAFGTAGLRGIIGAGTNRMNRYTVSEASQGLAAAVLEEGEEGKRRGVVIGYDVRHRSTEFARITAQVLAGNGIKVYLFDQITPTPLLSYSVRKLNTQAGVMVTASHNPKMYNGYKAYWQEGSQILDDIAERIGKGIAATDGYDSIPFADFEEAVEQGTIEMVGDKLVQSYLDEIEALAVTDDIDKDVCLVYSPLNGTGNAFVQEILRRRGFTNVHIVKEQEEPDPDFTSVPFPNPEEPKAFALAEKLGKEVGAEILIATDPDSDRIAMEVRNVEGDYTFINGNQIGSLLVHHILSHLQEQGRLPEDALIVKSIVTGNMTERIAQEYGVQMRDVLTGFKNIYAVANAIDAGADRGNFIFGFEESIGYSYGTYVRDKDAVMSAMLIAEMAGRAKCNGTDLLSELQALFEKYGHFQEKLISFVREGADGQRLIGRIMDDFRAHKLETIGDSRLVRSIDYQEEDHGIGRSNVLKFMYDDDSWYAVRPSGTEPKIKFYMYVVGDSAEDAQNRLAQMEKQVLAKAEAVS